MPPRNGWSEQQRALMRWLCLPDTFRDPPTLAALARYLDVSRELLYQWQKLSGWNDALAVVAKQTTLDLEPEYLKSLSAAMMKAQPNDRLVQAYWRYVRPSLVDENERGQWSMILPETSDDLYIMQNKFALGVSKLEALPLEDRARFLEIWRDVMGQAQEVEVVAQSFNVQRVYTGAGEQVEAEDRPVEMIALPLPGSAAAPGGAVVKYNPPSRKSKGRPSRKGKV